MKLCGNSPPLTIKNKGEWVLVDCFRWANYLKVPMKKEAPPGFPPNTIIAQRALVAIHLKSPDKLTKAMDALFEAMWTQHANVQDAGTVVEILEKAIGRQDAEAAMKGVQETEVKKQLSTNTNLSFEDGAFGLPWFRCTNSKGETEGLWGVDHLGQVVDFLGLERPGDRGWRALL